MRTDNLDKMISFAECEHLFVLACDILHSYDFNMDDEEACFGLEAIIGELFAY